MSVEMKRFSELEKEEKMNRSSILLILVSLYRIVSQEWSCGFRFQPETCNSPRMSFSTPYYNLGHPLIERFCDDVPCSGFESSDIPQEFTKSLFQNVTFVWVPDYNTKLKDLDVDVPSSGFKAQFDPIVVLSELGMNAYVALDLPSWFVKDLHPNIQTLKSLNQSFAREHAGRLLMSTPEVNANRLHRIMNRSGVLSKESEHVRQIMWVMGLERTVRQIKNEKMRVIGNVHHSHKQFYAPGSTPTTARLPEEQIRGTDSMKLSDVLSRKRNLVLVDRDAFHIDIYTIAAQVQAEVPDVEFIWLSGMTIDQVRETYGVKMIVIMHNHSNTHKYEACHLTIASSIKRLNYYYENTGTV